MENICDLKLEDFLKYIEKNIKYGFVDKFGNKHYSEELDKLDIENLYVLQSPEQVLKSCCAWCWDKVELIRWYLDKNNIPNETYYMEYKVGEVHHTHTFCIYLNDEKWYETSLHRVSDEKEKLIERVFKEYKEWLKEKFGADVSKAVCIKYEKPKYGISAVEFQEFCKVGKRVPK